MNMLTGREQRDIQAVSKNSPDDAFARLPEHRRTAAVSMAAVSACGYNLEYVPDRVMSKEICRAALQSKDVDCDILSHIPFPDVQREGIQKFSNIPAFVVYSFADISDAQMAKEAVKADAYCLQLVPDKLLTGELCKAAIQNPNADKKVLGFIPIRFQTPAIRDMAEDKFGDKPEQKKLSPSPHKKGISM